jgi:hypothetical protein
VPQLISLYKVVICGDRNRKAYYPTIVRREIRALKAIYGPTKLLLIAGGAPGIDTMVKEIGNEEDIHVAEIDALWNTRGRGAGPQRNLIMASLRPHEVIAIHASISESKGTARMLEIATKNGIPNRLVES